MDALFKSWDTKHTPGCALGVIRGGDFIYKRCYGMANLEHGIAITPDSVFDVGSTSKQFVAACVAMLARRRKLSLEDEVQKHIPEMPRYSRPVRLRHLLNHTSGIRDYLTLMDLAGLRMENEFPDEEIVELIARQKALNFNPGSQFMYSNSGYLLLGEVIRRVSGKTLRRFAHDNIFAPLGMKNTHFHDDLTEIVKNRASGYAQDKDKPRISISILDLVGDGGLNTTLNDLLAWDRNFYKNRAGGCGSGFMRELSRPCRLDNGEELNYAAGLFVEKYRGLDVIHHGGAWFGYRAEMIRFPRQELTVICLANSEGLSAIPLARQVADIFLEKEFPSPVPPLPAADFSAGRRALHIDGKTGFYESASGEITRLHNDGGYQLEYAGRAIQMKRLTPRSLQACNGELLLEFNRPKRYTISFRNGTKTEYAWLPPVKTQAAPLAGEYYCEELDVKYRIGTEGKKLMLKCRGKKAQELLPVTPGLFQTDISAKLLFARPVHGKARSFILNTNRVKALKFSRVPIKV